MFIVLYHFSCNHFPYTIKIKEKFTEGRKGERAGQLIRRTKDLPQRIKPLAGSVIISFEHLQRSPLSRELNSANLIQLSWKSAYNRGQTGLSQVQFSLPCCFVLSILWSGMCFLVWFFFTFLKKQPKILNWNLWERSKSPKKNINICIFSKSLLHWQWFKMGVKNI